MQFAFPIHLCAISLVQFLSLIADCFFNDIFRVLPLVKVLAYLSLSSFRLLGCYNLDAIVVDQLTTHHKEFECFLGISQSGHPLKAGVQASSQAS